MTNNLPIVSEEEQNLQEELSKIASHPKLAKWLQLFLDKSNKETFGNKTQSSIQAYNLDPVVQYYVGASIGYQNFKKLQTLASAYYERDGMTASKVLDLIAAHAINKGGKALEMLAHIHGLYDPKASIVINNNQTNTANIQVNSKEAEEMATEFEAFINNKYSNSAVVEATAG